MKQLEQEFLRMRALVQRQTFSQELQPPRIIITTCRHIGDVATLRPFRQQKASRETDDARL